MRLKETGKSPQEFKETVGKYMIETYGRFDFVCERAEGAYLYGESGQRYLDFYGGVAVNNTGSCHPRVVQAIQEQAAQVIHTFNYPYTVPQGMLAEKICTLLGYDKIFYQSSGTEANEAMIKLARKYGIEKYGPECYHIITAKKSFHGRTFGSMSATGQPGSVLHEGFGPLLPGFSYAEFNNVDDFRSQVTDQTIAIMLEPVQGEGGVHPATQEFMTGIAQLCQEKGLLLLMDEVQTGWARTGKWMGYEHYGIKPDIVSMAKGMGGGMPIGAICTSAEIAATFTAGTHGTTYGGNAVCCAASYAQISVLEEEGYVEKAQSMGDYLMELLRWLPEVQEVRGQGLLVGVQLKEPLAAQLKMACYDEGLLVTAIGDSIIRLAPPLLVTKEECCQAATILGKCIAKLMTGATQSVA